MSEVRIVTDGRLGFGFVPGEEDSLRPWPFGSSESDWRRLEDEEINLLISQENRADDWENIRVAGDFDPRYVRDCRFYGPNRIGSLSSAHLEHNDLALPVGLYSSTVVACDIGANVAIHNAAYLARTCIEDRCIIFNVQEIVTTNHAKFGNGVVMDGEDEELRIWLEIANENGGRKVLPFDGMVPSDAWIWSKFRDDEALMDRFVEMTDRIRGSKLGTYGAVGAGTVIKDSRILKDLRIGPAAYIKGANKLKNLTINSSPEQPTQIGEGCELVNGIIGYGCRIFYGVKAVRFILNDHSALKYGARLINSILGPNSTISCCEVLNSLLFAAHEQHHNSSFLCASVLKGMSNMASAATVGSNHNSRAADGEIVADRGFWPGLSVSLKHNSRFAAFTLVAKGAYPAELNIPLPFTLVSNNENAGELRLMPGYWFRYNMYALARNASKTAARDQRSGRRQVLEYDWLAPDTVDQMILGRRILEIWANEAEEAGGGASSDGRALLESDEDPTFFAGERFPVEASNRPVKVLHPGRAWKDYGRMIRFFAVRTLVRFGGREALKQALSKLGVSPGQQAADSLPDPWENVGGQLMRRSALEKLKDRVKSGDIADWQGLHESCYQYSETYPEEKVRYAEETLVYSIDDGCTVTSLVEEAVKTGDFILRGIRESRRKDYENEFRNNVYDSVGERDAVLGDFEDNEFIAAAERDWTALRQNFEEILRTT